LTDPDDRTRAFAGIGANVGDPAATLRKATQRLDEEEGIRVIAASPVYRNPPFGPQDQPHFLNAVLEMSVSISPQQLLQAFLSIEQEFGRVRDIRWGPRTLDLDILIYGDIEVDEPGLTIPHAHMLDRPFFLTPIADLHPQGRHPVVNKPYLELAEAVGRENLERMDVVLLPE
jgi:2-amino-4-hydroxy-6-hydroxymethyldihydropteridine diphosphokinase